MYELPLGRWNVNRSPSSEYSHCTGEASIEGGGGGSGDGAVEEGGAAPRDLVCRAFGGVGFGFGLLYGAFDACLFVHRGVRPISPSK